MNRLQQRKESDEFRNVLEQVFLVEERRSRTILSFLLLLLCVFTRLLLLLLLVLLMVMVMMVTTALVLVSKELTENIESRNVQDKTPKDQQGEPELKPTGFHQYHLL